MAGAGYSGTPLLIKLGLKPDMLVMLMNPPVYYYELLGMNLDKQLCQKKQIPDFIHLFALNFSGFKKDMKKISAIIQKNSKIIIWVSWYKKSTGIPTDMTEDVIRNYALKNGLVDIKVCAVNEKWSALKLVVPLARRK